MHSEAEPNAEVGTDLRYCTIELELVDEKIVVVVESIAGMVVAAVAKQKK